MRNWKVAVAGLAMWFGAAMNAHGLGLGDIEVTSALNQPLDAKIELLAITILVSPIRFEPAIPANRITVVSTMYDRVIPPVFSEDLAKKWGANLVQYPEGHLSLFLSGRIKKDIIDLLVQD